MNKQNIKTFADGFAARRTQLPRTFVALGNTVAAALRLWENQRPEIAHTPIATVEEPERMSYRLYPDSLRPLVHHAGLCGFEIRVIACDDMMVSISCTDEEAEKIRQLGFSIYPER